MDPILERTSVRKYTDQKISAEDEKKILEAAFAAPSAANKQPWEYLVIRNPQSLEKISTFSPYAGALRGCDMAVVVLANTSNDLAFEYDLMDCSAATENMLVEAKSLGIGSVWLGYYPETDRVEKLSAYLDLPENVVPLWVTAFGYPANTPKVRNKWDDAKIHYEKY